MATFTGVFTLNDLAERLIIISTHRDAPGEPFEASDTAALPRDRSSHGEIRSWYQFQQS